MSSPFEPDRGSSATSSLALLTLGVLVMLGAAQAAPAHDFWIEPHDYTPEPSTSVRLALRVGENFKGAPVRRQGSRIEQFVISGPEGESSVAGVEDRDPAGFVRIDAPGLYVAGYQSRRAAIALEAGRFEKYLAEEGLEAIIAARRARGESNTLGREVFSRCAKTIVSAGSARKGGGGFDTRIGCPLELIPESDPTQLPVNGSLQVRVVYRNQPIGGVQVVAISRRAPDQPIVLRSNDRGRVRIPIEASGAWLVKAVHMVPAPADLPESPDATWESFWASLTFEPLPARID